ncbi:hypothetical protein PHMEG_00023041 [Phytophthora megakarya]|uniref:Uncharacterized protein n=1 Tax=Phytophthora megakarya TaxID=4795 RepID=A0A225VKA8_9STRA|nr:hypothetical protein PHMEG_00023041 [Phytophthora megakarya]
MQFGRTTVDNILRATGLEHSANLDSKRSQKGWYHDMELELLEKVKANAGAALHTLESTNPVLDERRLLSEANEILKRSREDEPSVSAA